jgi:hypothetical protein
LWVVQKKKPGKSREIDEWVSYEGLAAHIGKDMGIDFGKLEPDEKIENLNIDGLQGYARMFEESIMARSAYPRSGECTFLQQSHGGYARNYRRSTRSMAGSRY